MASRKVLEKSHEAIEMGHKLAEISYRYYFITYHLFYVYFPVYHVTKEVVVADDLGVKPGLVEGQVPQVTRPRLYVHFDVSEPSIFQDDLKLAVFITWCVNAYQDETEVQPFEPG